MRLEHTPECAFAWATSNVGRTLLSAAFDFDLCAAVWRGRSRPRTGWGQVQDWFAFGWGSASALRQLFSLKTGLKPLRYPLIRTTSLSRPCHVPRPSTFCALGLRLHEGCHPEAEVPSPSEGTPTKDLFTFRSSVIISRTNRCETASAFSRSEKNNLPRLHAAWVAKPDDYAFDTESE